MSKIFQPSQRFWITKLRGEYKTGLQGVDKTALARDSKLRGQISVQVCDDVHASNVTDRCLLSKIALAPTGQVPYAGYVSRNALRRGK